MEAITIVPLDFSKITPIIVPKTISRPIFSIIFKNPDFISIKISTIGIFNKKPNSNEAERRTMKGFNFSLEVPNTIHTIETKMLNKEG